MRLDEVALGEDVRDRHAARALPREADVLEDEREADRGDQRREPRLVAERLVADALDVTLITMQKSIVSTSDMAIA